MTVSVATLTTGTDSDGGTSSTTASITPSANKLILATVEQRTGISADPVACTMTGNSLTWVSVATIVFDTTSSSRRRLTVFRAMGAAPTTGTCTIDCGIQATTDALWSIEEFSNVDTSGTNGSGAVVQSATLVDETLPALPHTFTATLAAFGNVNNATFGAVSSAESKTSGPMTVGSGFTLTNNIDTTVNTNQILTEFLASNDTTVDVTENTGNSAQMGIIAIEIKASAAGIPNKIYQTNFAVTRAAHY